MKPAPFNYIVPTSIDEALALLEEHAPDARLLAGGQSLVPMMNFRLSRPSHLIDLNCIPDLAFIHDNKDHISIGAMTRERTIEESSLVQSSIPLLYEATQHIAHLPIRSRGTIGGSISNADPAAEYPAALLTLDGEMLVRSKQEKRRIKASDFFKGIMDTAIEPNELLVEIIVPKVPPGTGFAFVEISRRHGDYALAGIAAQMTLSGKTVKNLRLAACGVGPCPIRLNDAEKQIFDDGLTEESIQSAARAAALEVDPETDLHATADYRRRLTAVLTQQALLKVKERAQENS